MSLRNFRNAQRAWDDMEPPCEDHDTDAMDAYCEPEPDDTDWDAIDYGNHYEGDK